MSIDPTAEGIVSLLAGGDRMRVVDALVLGADNLSAIADATGIPQDRAGRAVARLLQGGLVEHDGDALHFREDAVRSVARRPRPEEPVATDPSVRAFVKDGRLTAIPSSHSKRLQILNLIAQDFEVGVRYSERQVNDVIRRWHPDYAALRRYMVDDGFLQREGGVGHYWRCGGTVEV